MWRNLNPVAVFFDRFVVAGDLDLHLRGGWVRRRFARACGKTERIAIFLSLALNGDCEAFCTLGDFGWSELPLIWLGIQGNAVRL
jgi:hypothetical protein